MSASSRRRSRPLLTGIGTAVAGAFLLGGCSAAVAGQPQTEEPQPVADSLASTNPCDLVNEEMAAQFGVEPQPAQSTSQYCAWTGQDRTVFIALYPDYAPDELDQDDAEVSDATVNGRQALLVKGYNNPNDCGYDMAANGGSGNGTVSILTLYTSGERQGDQAAACSLAKRVAFSVHFVAPAPA